MGKKKTTSEFITDCISIHGDRYDYSDVSYTAAHGIVDVICKDHGKFSIVATNHLCGSGCPTCAAIQRRKTKTLKLDNVLRRATAVHGDKYDYSLVNYVKMKTKVSIICREHGVFEQPMSNHIFSKMGCPGCAPRTISLKKRKTLEWFLKRVRDVHGARYDYRRAVYVNDRTPLSIGCNKHGFFEQIPLTHMKGGGCPTCGMCYGQKERKWLDMLGVPRCFRQITVKMTDGSRIRADAFDGETIYEFWGDFWHGNPDIYDPDEINQSSKKTFGELYEATQRKRTRIILSGFKLVEIWENEFDAMNSMTTSTHENTSR